MSVAALPFIAMGVQAAGTIAQGIGANNEMRGAAAVDDENGRLSILAGEQDAGEVMRQARMAMGEDLAGMAGSGAGLGWGSASDVIVESLANRDADVAALRSRAAQEAANYRQAAKDKRAAGRNALIGSVFSAASGALTSMAGIKGQQQISASRGRVRDAVLGSSRLVAGRGDQTTDRIRDAAGRVMMARSGGWKVKI